MHTDSRCCCWLFNVAVGVTAILNKIYIRNHHFTAYWMGWPPYTTQHNTTHIRIHYFCDMMLSARHRSTTQKMKMKTIHRMWPLICPASTNRKAVAARAHGISNKETKEEYENKNRYRTKNACIVLPTLSEPKYDTRELQFVKCIITIMVNVSSGVCVWLGLASDFVWPGLSQYNNWYMVAVSII